jgi:PAS domain-containing protein
MHCSLLLLNESGELLRHGAAPSLASEYCAAVDGLKIGPLVGTCGAAAFHGESIFTADITTSANWADYQGIALKHGLAACWSSPILASTGAVLGTFAVYWGTPQQAVAPATRAYVEAATRLAAIAIESAQRDTTLRNIQQGLLRAEALGHLGSWTFNPVTRLSRWSDQMFTLFGRARIDGEPEFADFSQLVHPDDRPLIDTTLACLLAEEIPPEITYRRHPSLGPSCFLQGSFSLVRDSLGKVISIEGAVLDVTAAKQAEERWRGQLDELRRWQQVTLGREGRVLELKREVNALLIQRAEAPRYSSVFDQGMPP